jgi:hypothetical protein
VRVASAWGCAALAAAALAGCADDLQFRRDHRLRFVAPPARAEVTVPFDVAWTMDGRNGSFAVFVDRSPMDPGEDVESIAQDEDPACARATTCPDRQWLAEHHIFLTARTRMTIPLLPGDGGRRATAHTRRHELTVVLLDPRGRRIGESAWTRVVYSRKAPG